MCILISFMQITIQLRYILRYIKNEKVFQQPFFSFLIQTRTDEAQRKKLEKMSMNLDWTIKVHNKILYNNNRKCNFRDNRGNKFEGEILKKNNN